MNFFTTNSHLESLNHSLKVIAKLHLHTQRIKLIETRLSKLSSNEEIFTESAQVYQEQLQKAE